MTPRVNTQLVEAWTRRVRAYDGNAEYQQLLDELAGSPDAPALLDLLSGARDPIVRAWAGTAARSVFGRDAIPLLNRLLKDRDPDVRDVARQDLVDLDPAFERTFFPAYRRALKRRKDPWGEDRVAMFTLARAHDAEAVELLRKYAAHYEPRYWHNRMPLVLADYIEDPGSIRRRIREHDHAFMFWLVDATAILDVVDAEETLNAALGQVLDEACVEIIRDRLSRLRELGRRPL